MSWGSIISAAIGAYASYDAAKEQEKAAKEARKGSTGTTTRTPYMNEAISAISPYILSEAQKVYESRQGTYGHQPGDFSPFAGLLAQVPQGYSGVGPVGKPEISPVTAGPGSAFAPEAPAQDAPRTPYAPIRATIPEEGGQMPAPPAAAQQAQADPEMIRYWEQVVMGGPQGTYA